LFDPERIAKSSCVAVTDVEGVPDHHKPRVEL
jgi:hypothetical protein